MSRRGSFRVISEITTTFRMREVFFQSLINSKLKRRKEASSTINPHRHRWRRSPKLEWPTKPATYPHSRSQSHIPICFLETIFRSSPPGPKSMHPLEQIPFFIIVRWPEASKQAVQIRKRCEADRQSRINSNTTPQTTSSKILIKAPISMNQIRS